MDRRALLLSLAATTATAAAPRQVPRSEHRFDFTLPNREGIRLPDFAVGGYSGEAIFDTGAERCSISHALASRIGLVATRRQALETVTGRREAGVTDPVPISLQGVSLPPAPFFILPAEVVWEDAELLLSSTVFDEYALDFDASTITIPGSGHPSVELFSRLRSGMFSIGFGSGPHAHFLRIDTGSSVSSISTKAHRELAEEPSFGAQTIYETSAEGRVPVRVRFASLPCGEATFSDLIFRVVDAPVTAGLGYSGVIGIGNMLARNWRFSRSPRRVSVEPNGHQPLSWCPAGVRLSRREGRFIVAGLTEGAAAVRAGLQLGDEVVTVNGSPPGAHLSRNPSDICVADTTFIAEVRRSGAALTLSAPREPLF